MNHTVRPSSAGEQPQAGVPDEPPEQRRTEEFRTFIFLTLIMAPVLAVMVVGGYGFVIWIYQTFTGPPGAGLS